MMRQKSLYLVGALGGALFISTAIAEEGWQPAGLESTPILKFGKTRNGDTIVYPMTTTAQITSIIGTVEPGIRTELYKHAVPAHVYVLEGEIELWTDGELPQRYSQGEAYIETTNRRHTLHNVGTAPARILMVFVGQEGTPTMVPGD
jgi:quercetin dioxygenase-like cupin family protein